jgi:citrate synthase
MEQRGQDRLIRPQSRYTGPKDRFWVPLEKR